MPSHTQLVAQISEAGAIPANRPIDHARRIITAATVGVFFATMIAMFWALGNFSTSKILLMILPSAIMLAAFAFVWKVKQEDRGEPIPVIARTLATSESPYVRYVKTGSNKGLIVPVVVQPVDGSDPFRSVILMRQTGNEQVAEPEVGTLLALQQVERGLGELTNIPEVTPEQEVLRERLARHPRQLSNRAPALPMRRGTLERKPASAAAEWWLSMLAGAGLIFLLAWAMA